MSEKPEVKENDKLVLTTGYVIRVFTMVDDEEILLGIQFQPIEPTDEDIFNVIIEESKHFKLRPQQIMAQPQKIFTTAYESEINEEEEGANNGGEVL